MSYILVALRKADAQRNRDPALGIHAQPAHAVLHGPARLGTVPAVLWAAAVLGIVSLAAAWAVSGPREQAPDLPVLASSPPAAPAAVTIPVPPPPVATQILPPAPAMPSVALPAQAPQPSAAQRRNHILAVPGLAAPAASTQSAGTTALVSARETLPAASSDDLPKASQLPADVQSGLPKMSVTGGVYSQNPAQRMLIVNGQVFSEGAEPAPGVLLEQIRAGSAVLVFRGHRYSVPY